MRSSIDTKDPYNIANESKRRSSSSITSDSFIFIILDCYSYTAGEKVTGEILFNVCESIPKSYIKFQSRGIEEIHVFDSQDRTKVLVEEIQEVFTLDTCLTEWESEVPIGQYVFPFNFKIPNYCPSTFYYSGEDSRGNYIKAEVFYHISIKLIVSGVDSGLSHSRIINIKNISTLEKPSPSIEAVGDVSGCCFLNKGRTQFKLSVANVDHCNVDGEIKYKLYPNNSNCKAPINHVIGSVVLDFTVRTRKGDYKIIKKLSEIDRPTWISAFTSLIYEKDFEYQAELKVSSDELNPSSNKSPIIMCEYFIEILVFYDLKCMTRPIVIRLPFHVNPKLAQRKEGPKLPTDWNPIESSIFNLSVDNRKLTINRPDEMAESKTNIN